MKKTLLLLAAMGGFALANAFTAPTAEELAKLNMQIENDVDGAFANANEVTIEYSNGQTNQIEINNFLSSGSIVRATVDWETGDIKIYPQTCGMDYDSYDYYLIVSSAAKNGDPMSIFSTYVSGKYDGKSITLEAWNLMKVPYNYSENKGTVYAKDLTTSLVSTNGTFKYTMLDTDENEALVAGEQVTVPVYAELASSALTVYNWGGQPAAVKLNQTEGNTWTVDMENPAWTTSRYNFYVYPLAVTGDNAGKVDSSKPALVSAATTDAHTVSFGPWFFYDQETNRSRSLSQDGVLTLDFDLPITTGIGQNVAEKAVKAVKYVNLAGLQSNTPFDGVNIVITTYADGTQKATKVIK